MIHSLSVIYSTTTGHTECVVEVLERTIRAKLPQIHITRQKAELTSPDDLKKSDVLILACGSWNTGNIEGQLSPYMHELLTQKAASVDLRTIRAAAIGLGDDRYFFTARSAELLQSFLQDRGASIIVPALKVINDPYDQEAKIIAWAEVLASAIAALPASPSDVA